MPGRIIEISGENRSVHLYRGFLDIRDEDGSIGRVPLDELDAVIGAARGIMWSNNALASLAQRGVPLVIIGQNFAPEAYILPVCGHHEQGAKIAAQAAATKPMKKRLWAQLVKAKISAQAAMLDQIGLPDARLKRLAKEVQSGDATNREAIAAQYYWPQIFDAGFKRDRDADGINAMLNYGYAVLRAATARAIVAAGLSPSLSLHHASRGNALRLADDLMEPFRPCVDLAAYDLHKSGEQAVTPEVKRALAQVLEWDFKTDNGHTPLSHVLVRLAQSLATVFTGGARTLDLPRPLHPTARTLLSQA